MKRKDCITAMQPDDLRLDCSATWGGARAATQTVAFRVTGIRDDADKGCVPIWEACPLTKEEEAILEELRLNN
jgi:hypothetical protein